MAAMPRAKLGCSSAFSVCTDMRWSLDLTSSPSHRSKHGSGQRTHIPMMAVTSFIPRAVFPALDSLPRSYYLGHHAAGLAKMRTLLSQIDLIIECRDYRIPLTSRNPQFEDVLSQKERVIVYTKKDLASSGSKKEDREVRLASNIPILGRNSQKADVYVFLHRSPTASAPSITPPASLSQTSAPHPTSAPFSLS